MRLDTAPHAPLPICIRLVVALAFHLGVLAPALHASPLSVHRVIPNRSVFPSRVGYSAIWRCDAGVFGGERERDGHRERLELEIGRTLGSGVL